MADNEIYTEIANLQKLVRGNTSQSFAMLNTVMAETIGMSMHNAVSTQHNSQTLNSAATASTCARILSVIGAKALAVPAAASASDALPPANTGTPVQPAAAAGTPPVQQPPAGSTTVTPTQPPPAGGNTGSTT